MLEKTPYVILAMMHLEELCASITGFSAWKYADKIKLFAWHLHTFGQQKFFTPTQIAKCFNDLNIAQPTVVAPFLLAMANRNPPEAIRTHQGYCLERRTREALDTKYGKRQATVHIDRLLAELPDKIPTLSQRDYLNEALICFRFKAFRAAIVMSWNLAYDHLCDVIFNGHLSAFNTQLPKTFPRAEISVISKKEDFAELKESQVLQVCRSALIISGSLHKILKEKLDRRNLAAHPTGVAIPEPTAEEFIKDLIENVVLKLI